MAHPNLDRLQAMTDSWARGDLDAVNEFWTEDAVWRVPGNHQLAGTHKGRDAINAVSVRFMELSNGTLRLEPLDAMADDHHVICVWHATANKDGRTLDVEDANAILVDDEGKFTACWWLPNDQAAFDAFWR